VGEKHNVAIGLSYLVHPAVSSLSGALAIGLTFPVH